ncbi:MAG: metal ABC transporter ATP-binding protein [Nitrososphaeria archaeon]|nr:metal ABC transporter ATP-binding protein [Nitrososphaeria archaeon]
MNVIELENVRVRLNGKEVLENIGFKVEESSFLSIMGPNGSGKTTLIKVLLGIIVPDSGTVRVFGADPIKNPFEVRRVAGYVPQKEKINLEVPLTVSDVVGMGLISKKHAPRFFTRKDRERIEESLKLVDMWDYRNEMFANLSGGQQQRVLIARAIVHEPKILLLDEPFNGVDANNQRKILEFLGKMKSEKVTIVVVTHDINPLAELTDYVMLLNRKIVSFGRPTEALDYVRLCQIYGPSVQVITGKPCPTVITGDVHA